MPPQWIKQMPGFRVYAELDETTKRLEESAKSLDETTRHMQSLKKELKHARAELKAAKARADLAGGTLTEMAAVLDTSRQEFVSQSRLEESLATKGLQYRAAKPFPHIVIDNFIDPDMLQKVAEEFSTSDRAGWHHSEGPHEKKSSSEDEQPFGPFTRALVHVLNAGPFVTFLEKLTHIEGIISDPHLRGGGLHEIKRGGKLGVHADFNFYQRLKLYRRLNLIIYLNAGWRDEWGGHLELWDRDGKAPIERIAPIFNRAVIFDTSNSSYHGHPSPLQCPEDQSRKSIALYYYSVDYPYEEDRERHTTIFLNTEEAHEHEHEH